MESNFIDLIHTLKAAVLSGCESELPFFGFKLLDFVPLVTSNLNFLSAEDIAKYNYDVSFIAAVAYDKITKKISIDFNLELLDGMNLLTQFFVIYHECCHLKFDHIKSIVSLTDSRDRFLMNIAQDCINNFDFFIKLFNNFDLNRAKLSKLQDLYLEAHDCIMSTNFLSNEDKTKKNLSRQDLIRIFSYSKTPVFLGLKPCMFLGDFLREYGLLYKLSSLVYVTRIDYSQPSQSAYDSITSLDVFNWLIKYFKDRMEDPGGTSSNQISDIDFDSFQDLTEEELQSLQEVIIPKIIENNLDSYCMTDHLDSCTSVKLGYKEIDNSLLAYLDKLCSHRGTKNSGFTYGRVNYSFSTLPGHNRINKPQLACILDTSGSISEKQAVIFLNVLRGLYPKYRLDLLFNDTVVRNVEKVRHLSELDSINWQGGGGTDLNPSFDFLLNKTLSNIYQRILVFTDGIVPPIKFSLDSRRFVFVIPKVDGVIPSGVTCPVIFV